MISIGKREYYTLDEAREIIREENRKKALRRQRIERHKREILKYYMIQKSMGIFFILVSLAMILIDNDATVALFFVPLGLYLIFTREKVII